MYPKRPACSECSSLFAFRVGVVIVCLLQLLGRALHSRMQLLRAGAACMYVYVCMYACMYMSISKTLQHTVGQVVHTHTCRLAVGRTPLFKAAMAASSSASPRVSWARNAVLMAVLPRCEPPNVMFK